MNKEFLYNYEKNEISNQQKHYEKIRDNAEDPIGYPDNSRFSKTNSPLVLCDSNTYRHYGEKIWSQVPFAGTLIIPLTVSTKRNFLTDHGFDVNDIDKMIDLAKDTGRIQFVLSTKPTLYEGLDHLQSVFEELRPPIITTPWNLFGSDAEYDRWINEFNDIAVAAYDNELWNRTQEAGERVQYFKSMRSYQASIYAKINWLKMEDAVEDIKNYIHFAPDYVISLLDYCGFLTENLYNPIRFNHNYSLETLKFYNSNFRAKPGSQFQAPVEIGAYIMKKITRNPQNYYGCLGVIDQYNQNDLYTLLESLDKGIRSKRKEQVLFDIQQVRMILDNIWKDADKINSNKDFTSWGIGLTIGIAGFLLTGGLSSFATGLLASLGFTVTDKLLDSMVSKKVVRLLNRDYIYNIYDFKEKYSINKRQS
jgi:hypothetical protein